eukprot:gene41159-50942_t
MALTAAEVLKMVQDNEVKFVDFRFADTRGKEQHVTVPVSHFDIDKFESGHAFDGSSIAGWKGIEASDMILLPDPATANIDPFMEETTLFMQCDVIEPSDGKGYDRDPRSIAKRAEAYLKSSGLGDTAYFGPEPEFFIFDSVKWKIDMSGAKVQIDSDEASWSTDKDIEGGNSGHRPTVKGGYFPVPPVDSFQDMRSEMCLILESLGIPVEVHHHEVAGAGQNEIGTKFSTLVERADWTQNLKYVVWNVAHSYGKTATFMPKPIVGDNGSGMHVHQSIWKDGKNLFAGDGYHLTDPAWVILDCRHDLMNPNAGRDGFAIGHIQNAQFASIDDDLSGPKAPAGAQFTGRHPLPERGALIETLRNWGINDSTQVVAYDAHGGMFAARLWWLLRWVITWRSGLPLSTYSSIARTPSERPP